METKVTFKFAIGQFVVQKLSKLRSGRMSDSSLIACTYQVIAKAFEESEGGIDLKYICRPQDYLGSKELIVLYEIELVPLDENT